MRTPLFALALLSLAAAAAAKPKDPLPAPGDDFVSAACESGLLVRSDPDAQDAPDVDQATSGFDDLTGGDEPAAEDGAKDKPTPKPKKKPKTKVLRAKKGAEKGCPERMRAFYSASAGRGLNAVIAPKDVPVDELRAHADDVFASMSPGSKKGERLSDLARLGKADVAKRVEFADRLFDNAGPLDKADFPSLTAKADGLTRGMDAADGAAKAAALLGTSAPPPEPAKDPAPAAKEPAAAPADAYTAAPGAGLPGGLPHKANVPPARSVPAAREAWTGPDYAPPAESGWLRQKYNDYSAVARDVIAGKPITTEMGWAPGVINPWLHGTTPARLDGSPGVDRMLPTGQAGLDRECQHGHDPNYACWGTKDMVAILTSVGQKYDAYFKKLGGSSRINVGDISKRGGGHLSGHVSHQRGVDVDLRFAGGRGGFNVQANTMVIAALMLSVPNFHHIPGQEMILVDQSLHGVIGAGLDRLAKEGVITADESRRAKGSLRHWPHHRDHFHVRIKLGDAVVAPQAAGTTPAGDQD